jgi:GrpB protein
VTEGGLVESLQPVGSTSLKGARGSGVVDIALAVWPFPVAGPALAALRRLGYRPLPGQPAGPKEQAVTEQRFRHARKGVQLWFVAAGSDEWQNYLTVRDYLEHLGPAAARPAGNHARHFQRLLPRAEAWWMARHGFTPVEELAAEMAGFERPWHIASGWAIDLFLGQVGRVHHDIDVEVAREDQLALRAHLEARGWKFVTPYDGRLERWPPDTRLEGARHQAHAHRGEAFIDCLFTNRTAALWTYRRRPEVVRLMARAELRTTSGVPYLAPELVLLFKSKNTSANKRPRPQDAADFERAEPCLDPERRAWLRWALTAVEPEHPWIKRLA